MSKTVFRVLLVISLLSFCTAIGLPLLLPGEVLFPAFQPLMEPYELHIDYSDPWDYGIFFAVLSVFLLFYIIPWIGLFFFYRWARIIYAIFYLSMLLLYVAGMLDPTPYLPTPYELFFAWIWTLVDGALLALMWTEPLRHQFRGVSKEAL